MIRRAYKYRIYPTKIQEESLSQHFGCARYVYNWGLSRKIETYQQEKKTLSFFDLCKKLVFLKQEYEWLKNVDSQSLQMGLRNLDNAFTHFFREKKGFPKFKSKKSSKQSCQFPQRVKVYEEESRIQLPKIGKVKIKLDRLFRGKIKTVTVSRTSSYKYFVSVLVETENDLPKKPKIVEQTTLGIDLGIKHFAVYSNGTKIENPRYLKKSLQRLAFLQQKLSKTALGSHNREKLRRRIAKLHEKITNRRKDFLHKLSYQLTHMNTVDTIALETLDIEEMLQNSHLAQSISDVSWRQFITYLEYKAEWYGKNILRIGQFQSSSKMCSVCGYIYHDLKLSEREWTCSQCGCHHDRDFCASQNIKQFALQSQNLIS